MELEVPIPTERFGSIESFIVSFCKSSCAVATATVAFILSILPVNCGKTDSIEYS